MKSLLQHAQTTTGDGLILNGFYARGNRDKPTCILIHGFTGDPYSHVFYHAIADALVAKGIGLILAQHRGTGLHTEFLKANGDATFLGSYYECIADAHLDISAWIDWLHEVEGNDHIVLLGHSLGGIKAIRYIEEGEHASRVEKLVVLGPFAKGAFIEQKSPGIWRDQLDAAKQKVTDGHGDEVVPPEYEDFAVSYRTFVSWYEENDLSNMYDFHKSDYDFPALQIVNVPTLVQIGGIDNQSIYPDQGVNPAQVLTVFDKYVPDVRTILIPGANHVFNGHEVEVAVNTAKFLAAN